VWGIILIEDATYYVIDYLYKVMAQATGRRRLQTLPSESSLALSYCFLSALLPPSPSLSEGAGNNESMLPFLNTTNLLAIYLPKALLRHLATSMLLRGVFPLYTVHVVIHCSRFKGRYNRLS